MENALDWMGSLVAETVGEKFKYEKSIMTLVVPVAVADGGEEEDL